MDGSKIVEKIHDLLFMELKFTSPVLSGSMKMHIADKGVREIEIDAPFYDIPKWQRTGVITYTGQVIDGRTAYAEWVNRFGGFFSGNKSMYWVNRALVECAEIVANEIGAVVINELPL